MKKIILISLCLIIIGILVIHPCVSSIIPKVNTDNERVSILPRYHYYTYDEMTILLQELQQNHSDIFRYESIGTTYEGRDIWMVKISDNVSVDEQEPEILLMGAHHGDEKISYEVLIYFMKYVTNTYDNGIYNEKIRSMVDDTEIVIVPMVNPDGVEQNTRKNCEPNYGPDGKGQTVTSIGVNINRNYGYKWELFDENPSKYNNFTSIIDSHYNYRGEKPFSENETRAIRDLVNRSEFVIALSYHSCLGAIIYPWGYTDEICPDNELLFSIAQNMSYIYNYRLYSFLTLLGSEFPYQLAHRFFGLQLGTSDDWLYGEHNILSFTIELGTPLWILKSYFFDYFNLFHGMNMHNMGKAPVNPELVLDSCVNTVHVGLYLSDIASDIQNH